MKQFFLFTAGVLFVLLLNGGEYSGAQQAQDLTTDWSVIDDLAKHLEYRDGRFYLSAPLEINVDSGVCGGVLRIFWTEDSATCGPALYIENHDSFYWDDLFKKFYDSADSHNKRMRDSL